MLRVFALGQTPCKQFSFRKPDSQASKVESGGRLGGTKESGTGTPPHTPLKSIICYHCGCAGHVWTTCLQLSQSSGNVANSG